MPLVDVQGGLWMPPPEYFGGTVPAFNPALLDAAADRFAVVFYVPKTGNIRKIGFLLGTVAALNASSTLIYALQDVSLTTGLPDGTDDQTATIPNGSIVANTMVLSPALSADRAVTKGDLLAAVVRYGAFTAGDQVQIQFVLMSVRQGSNISAYPAINVSGSYGILDTGLPVFEIEYDDGTHAWSPALSFPYSALANDSFSNASTPDEIGLRFQVKFGCRLAGCWVSADMDGDYNINLYTAAGKTTVKSVDKDVRASTADCTRQDIFTTPVVLTANTTYVLSFEPTSATSILLRNHSVRAVEALDQMAGGQEWHYATAKNPASTADFAMTTTKRLVMGLMFDQVFL